MKELVDLNSPSKLKIQCKKGVYFIFHLILFAISSSLIVFKEKEGLLNEQNVLSMTKGVQIWLSKSTT